MKQKDILGWLILVTVFGIWIAYGLNRQYQIKVRAKFTVARIVNIDSGRTESIDFEYMRINEIYKQRSSLINSPYFAKSYNIGQLIVAAYDSVDIAAAAVFDAFLDENLKFGDNINYYTPAALDTLLW